MGWRLGAGPWRLKTCGKCSSPPRSPSNVIILCVEDKTQVCVCVVCSSYSSFAPSPPFFSSRWQNDFASFTHTLVLQGSLLTSSRQPQTTHVFAHSRIGLLCHALRICVQSCPSFLLVHGALWACYRNRFLLLHHASLPQNLETSSWTVIGSFRHIESGT